MAKLSYTKETIKQPYIWLIIVVVALLLGLHSKRQDFDDFSYFSAIILLVLFVVVMFRENNRAIRNIKYKSGKRLTLL